MTFFVEQLKEKGLKVTPQRLAVLGAVACLKNHPSAEHVIDYIKRNHPNVSVGTVYKVLDFFVAKKLLRKVKSEGGVMRYDCVGVPHHHLYCSETERIEDYMDAGLDEVLRRYFEGRRIKDFVIENVVLQITGKFRGGKGGKG